MCSDHASGRLGFESSTTTHGIPAFDFPETDGSGWTLHGGPDFTPDGVSVLGFYPFDSLEDAASLSWLQFTEGVDVVVATDAHPQSLDSVGPPLQSLPLLCDPEGEVAEDYGVDYGNVSARRVLLIDSSREVVRTWSSEHDPRDVHAAALEQVETGASSSRQGGN